MKTVLVIEPVVTCSPDNADELYLSRLKNPDTVIKTVSISRGPASIETFYDEALAVPEILHAVERYADQCDAIMINCFADPGVRAAREMIEIPVVGPAESSMALALLLGHRFAVVSTMRNSGPWTELQARAMGVEQRLAGAVGIDIPVLRLETDLRETARQLIEAANELITTKGADVVILGCTGMAPVADAVRAALPVPVIEPMAAAFKTAEMLAELGLRHSRTGLYMPPDKSKLVY